MPKKKRAAKVRTKRPSTKGASGTRAAAAFEKLGAFYLGREHDTEQGVTHDAPLLYDAKDLTTHAVCIGMTGSGKTGLCVSLLEEAAIDGIPAIAIDPKGDLGNLLLTFPDLAAASFEPWIEPGRAEREGLTSKEYAARIAKVWREGLADWGQDGARIARMRESVDLALYTPGSRSGRPLSILDSLAAPPPKLLADEDALREKVVGTVSSILVLIGVDPDPVAGREHILLSRIVDAAWRGGESLDLAQLIRSVRSPPFTTVGVFDLESFFPEKDRFAFAMRLNNLLASPAFAAWNAGEPLDVGRLLWTPEGKPRLSIVSIAHLSDEERMFVVSLLLSEMVTWMRSQPGTSSLRAILYMDEVFGYLPPGAKPPSKTPLLTMLKQARAHGLGVVLSTQNPVDLDYKALSNAGTWFLGRLQTERDKDRVLDGLEGVAAAKHGFDRKKLSDTLSSLGKRVFLMHDVHEERPVTFHTRWAMSYLRGPFSREETRRLASAGIGERVAPEAGASPAAQVGTPESSRPLVPPGVSEGHLGVPAAASVGEVLYRPTLLGRARLHHVSARLGVDTWSDVSLLLPLGDEGRGSWDEASDLNGNVPADGPPAADDARFAPLPAKALGKSALSAAKKELASFLYRERPLTIYKVKALELVSSSDEDEAAFRARAVQAARESRDLAVEKLRKRHAPKLKRLEDRVRRARERIDREESQYSQRKMETAISLGATVLGALFGRKAASLGTLGRATTTARGAGRAARERGDVSRAKDDLARLEQELRAMEEAFAEEIATLEDELQPVDVEVEQVAVRPRKTDMSAQVTTVVWDPWIVGADGLARRAR